MKYENTLIVSDIDGTFIDRHGHLVPRNIDAIRAFEAQGGMFAIATGRVPASLGGVLADVAENLCNVPCICCNGAYSYDFRKKERHSEIFVPYEPVISFINEVIEKYPNLRIRMSTTTVGYIVHTAEPNPKPSKVYTYCRLDEVPRCGWFRIAFDGAHETLMAIRREIEPRYRNVFDFVTSCPTIYEFNEISATKGTAIDRLRQLLIQEGRADSSLKIYAVGDYENDLDMLRHCDVPACPDNAIDSVKAIAEYHLCHCDDGAIGDLIERIHE